MIVLKIIFYYWFLAESLVYTLSRRKKHSDYDYILILGNKGGRDNPVAQDRIKNAVIAKKEFPKAKIVLTGNETYREVTNFKEMLALEGITDVIEETLSKNTWENMIFSNPLMGHKPKVLVITSNYHQPRSLAMARSLGMQADIFGKDFVYYNKAQHHFVKERLSNMLYSPRIFLNYMKKFWKP